MRSILPTLFFIAGCSSLFSDKTLFPRETPATLVTLESSPLERERYAEILRHPSIDAITGKVTVSGVSHQFMISPDHKKLAYVAKDSTEADTDLFIMNYETLKIKRLKGLGTHELSPFYVSNTKIAFLRQNEDKSQALIILDLERKVEKELLKGVSQITVNQQTGDIGYVLSEAICQTSPPYDTVICCNGEGRVNDIKFTEMHKLNVILNNTNPVEIDYATRSVD